MVSLSPEQFIEALSEHGVECYLVVTTMFEMRKVNRVRRAASGTQTAQLFTGSTLRVADVALRGGKVVDVTPLADAPYSFIKPLLEVMDAPAQTGS